MSVIAAAALLVPALAREQSPIDEVRPAPPSIGADVPLTYFAPAPSTDEPGLIGPLQLLRSGPVDLDEGTITLPLYEGRLESGGERRDDKARAKRRAAKPELCVSLVTQFLTGDRVATILPIRRA